MPTSCCGQRIRKSCGIGNSEQNGLINRPISKDPTFNADPVMTGENDPGSRRDFQRCICRD